VTSFCAAVPPRRPPKHPTAVGVRKLSAVCAPSSIPTCSSSPYRGASVARDLHEGGVQVVSKVDECVWRDFFAKKRKRPLPCARAGPRGVNRQRSCVGGDIARGRSGARGGVGGVKKGNTGLRRTNPRDRTRASSTRRAVGRGTPGRRRSAAMCASGCEWGTSRCRRQGGPPNEPHTGARSLSRRAAHRRTRRRPLDALNPARLLSTARSGGGGRRCSSCSTTTRRAVPRWRPSATARVNEQTVKRPHADASDPQFPVPDRLMRRPSAALVCPD